LSTAAHYGYRVDHIEIDASKSCVFRSGVEHVLRYQSFQVLLYLLEHAGKLVSKDELIAEIWQHAAVSDNALTQCIAEIRKALGDDSRHPTYIKTISKVGYQFVAQVEIVGIDETQDSIFLRRRSSTGTTPVALKNYPHSDGHPLLSVTSNDYTFGKKKLIIFYSLAACLLILLFSVATARVYRKNAAGSFDVAPSTAGRSLAVMYFENESQNHNYDWLKQGLTDMMITDMSRSGEMHVLGRQELATFMDERNRDNQKAPADQAMRIAEAAHATDFLTGSFAAMAGQFRIDIQLHDSRNGQIIYADHSVVENSSDILNQVDVLATRLANAMALNNTEKPNIAEVTTNNLEAYQYYSLGVEKAQEFENGQALVLLKQAIELDPNYAMAYARIGYTYALADFAPDKGRPYLQKALQLSGHLSKKDRLYVNAWYDISNADYNAAAQTLKKITNLYPQEEEAYLRLACLLRAEERPLDAIGILQRGLAFDPNDKNLRNTLGFVLLSLHRYPEAIAAEQRYVELAPAEPNSYDSLGMAYQQSGNYPAAMSEYGTALFLNPQFEPSIIHMGDVYYQTAQYAKAITEYQHYVQVADTDNARALGYGNLAAVYLAMHRMDRARDAAALELASNPNAVWSSIVIALKMSDYKSEKRFEQILFKNIPNQERGTPGDQRTKFYYRGYIDLQEGKAQEALIDFRTALQHLPPSSGMDTYEDCLANAELQLGHYKDAAAEYQRILKLNPNYPLARERFARAESHARA
jgi:DNA-binding winged helix-turn-helix (wHTH) protein/predicted Zn-dependent protease/TolB-like protein